MRRLLLTAALALLAAIPLPARAADHELVPRKAEGALEAPRARAGVSPFPDPSLWTTEEWAEAEIQIRVDLARRAAAEGDVLGWLQYVMPSVFNLPFCELHRWQVAHRHTQWTSLQAPRGHSKTTIGLVGIPLYQALNEPQTYRHYLILQSNTEKAEAINIAIKMELEGNPVIARLYGPQVGPVWNNGQFVMRNGICFTARGAGTSLRGTWWRMIRPDWISLDDLYNEEDIYSQDGTKKKTEWFWSTLFPARNKSSKWEKFNVQGTAINEQDVLCKVAQDPNFTSACFSATKEDGTPLWPELNDSATLAMERASMGDTAYEREMEMKRGGDKESIIKKHMLASWRRPASDFRCESATDPYRLLDVVVGVDPSVGKKQNAGQKAATGDPAGYVRVWKFMPLLTPGALPIYFIDALLMQKLDMQKRIETAKTFVTTARPDRAVRRLRVETISGFDDIGTLIASACPVPVEKVDHVADKMLNLEKNAVLFQNGRVFINDAIDPKTIEQIEYQLTTNHPQHDDGRDALFLVLDQTKRGMAEWVLG